MPETADDQTNAILELVEEGEFDDALTHIDKIQQTGFKNLDQDGRLSALRWYCQFCLDDDIELDDLDLVVVTEKRSEFLNGFGTQLGQVGAHHLAAPVFERLVALEPNRSLAWHKLGLTRFLNNEPNRAIEPLQKALTLDGTFSSSFFILGECFSQIGMTSDAASAFAGCVELAPDDVDALILCGIANSQAGDTQVATAMFEKALEIEPGNVSAFYNLSVIAFSNDNIRLLTDIQSRYEKHAESDPRSSLIDAYSHELDGNLEAAWSSLEAAFQQAIEVEHWDTLNHIADRAFNFCRKNSALEKFNTLIDEVFFYELFSEDILSYFREMNGGKVPSAKCFNVIVEGEFGEGNSDANGSQTARTGYFWGAHVLADEPERAGKLAVAFDQRCGRTPLSVSSVEFVAGEGDYFDAFEGVCWCHPEVNTFTID